MRELSRVMPKGSWLQTTQASVARRPRRDRRPRGRRGRRGGARPGPQATLVGCTPKQSEVAKILVRLRAMHRVTDVELNESVREQAVSDVTVDSCGCALQVRRDRDLRAAGCRRGAARARRACPRRSEVDRDSLTDRDRKIAAGARAAARARRVLVPAARAEARGGLEGTDGPRRRAAAAPGAGPRPRGQASGDKTDFAADYGEIVRLGKAIPAKVDMPSLLVQLDRAAEGTGITFTKISQGEREAVAPAAPPATTPPADGTTPAAPAAPGTPAARRRPPSRLAAPGRRARPDRRRSRRTTPRRRRNQAGRCSSRRQTRWTPDLDLGGRVACPWAVARCAGSEGAAPAPVGLETVPLDLEFVGNFFSLADFFHDIKRFVHVAEDNVIVNGRLMTIEGVNFSSDTTIFPKHQGRADRDGVPVAGSARARRPERPPRVRLRRRRPPRRRRRPRRRPLRPRPRSQPRLRAKDPSDEDLPPRSLARPPREAPGPGGRGPAGSAWWPSRSCSRSPRRIPAPRPVTRRADEGRPRRARRARPRSSSARRRSARARRSASSTRTTPSPRPRARSRMRTTRPASPARMGRPRPAAPTPARPAAASTRAAAT